VVTGLVVYQFLPKAALTPSAMPSASADEPI
jgi:hypothetical protein